MNSRRIQQNKGMIALMTIFGVGLLALVAALSVSSAAALGLVGNKNAFYGTQSFYSSDSAVSEVGYQMQRSTTYDPSANPYPLINGSAQISVATSSGSGYHILISATSSAPGVARVVNEVITTCESCEAFNYALYSPGNLTLNGNTTITGGGGIYSNGTVAISGSAYVSNTPTYGSLPAPTIDLSSIPFTHTSLTQADFVNYLATHTGGIVYVDTVADETVDSDFTGLIVSTHNLLVKNATINPIQGYPVIICGGTLDFNGTNIVNGVVITKDIADPVNSTKIIGSLILTDTANQNVKLNGNSSIVFDSNSYGGNITTLKGLVIPTPGSAGSLKLLNWSEQ